MREFRFSVEQESKFPFASNIPTFDAFSTGGEPAIPQSPLSIFGGRAWMNMRKFFDRFFKKQFSALYFRAAEQRNEHEMAALSSKPTLKEGKPSRRSRGAPPIPSRPLIPILEDLCTGERESSGTSPQRNDGGRLTVGGCRPPLRDPSATKGQRTDPRGFVLVTAHVRSGSR